MHRRGAGTGCEIPGAGGRCSRFRADIKSAPTVWTEVHAVGGVPGPGGWRADVGISPYEAEPSNPGGNRNLVPGGHKARPYEETGGGAVGAACMAARAHRRVGCTIAERTPLGIDNKSTIAERTRCGGASGDGAKYPGPVVDAAGFGRIYNPPLQGRKPRSPAKIGSRFRAAM